MKKFAAMLEDLWVAVTFAEAGIFEAVVFPSLSPGFAMPSTLIPLNTPDGLRRQ